MADCERRWREFCGRLDLQIPFFEARKTTFIAKFSKLCFFLSQRINMMNMILPELAIFDIRFLLIVY
jgi:hypothetical protein